MRFEERPVTVQGLGLFVPFKTVNTGFKSVGDTNEMSSRRLLTMDKFDPRTTALLIINMTNDLLGWEGVRPLVPRLEKLLERGAKVFCHRCVLVPGLL